MSRRETALTAIADSEGINIEYARPMRGTLRGGWIPGRRLILVAEGMTTAQTVSTLGHELGHALLHHRACAETRYKWNELSAWEWAARQLIDPVIYELLEPQVGHRACGLAEALDVTPPVIEAYQRILDREDW